MSSPGQAEENIDQILPPRAFFRPEGDIQAFLAVPGARMNIRRAGCLIQGNPEHQRAALHRYGVHPGLLGEDFHPQLI